LISGDLAVVALAISRRSSPWDRSRTCQNFCVKDSKELGGALKPVYQPANADLAAAALDAFAEGPWRIKFPTVAAMWQRQW